MEIIAAKEAKNNFGALLDNAQRAPIMIQKHQRDIAVILSATEYKQLKLERLRAKLAIGEEQANRGEFSNKSVKEIVEEAKEEYAREFKI